MSGEERMKNIIVFFMAAIFLGANMYIFVPSIMRSNNKIEKLDKQAKELDSRISFYKQEIAEYEGKIEKMKDEFYKEKMGRDKHKLIKEGETIYRPIVK